MNTPAPIAFFVYNRPAHTRRVLDSLKANPLSIESELFIFADTPREFGAKGVSEVRNIILALDGFKSIKIIVRDHHFGLSKNTIGGLTQLSDSHGRFILVEDDTLVSPFFLEWSNHFLNVLKDEGRVAAIQGGSYPVKLPNENFFVCSGDTSGLCSWKRAWDLFEPNGRKLADEISQKNLIRKFNFDGCFNYFGMLKDQIEGRNDSWSIRFYASILLKNKLTLYPTKSLVRNIGFDGTGTNCTAKTSAFDCSLAESPITFRVGPVEESKYARQQIGGFLRMLNFRIFFDLFIHLRWMTIGKALWKRLQ